MYCIWKRSWGVYLVRGLNLLWISFFCVSIVERKACSLVVLYCIWQPQPFCGRFLDLASCGSWEKQCFPSVFHPVVLASTQKNLAQMKNCSELQAETRTKLHQLHRYQAFVRGVCLLQTTWSALLWCVMPVQEEYSSIDIYNYCLFTAIALVLM